MLNKRKWWSNIGVHRAVECFQAAGHGVVLVTPREQLKSEFTETIHLRVVIAERTDDIMVADEAFNLNCPIVTRDRYREHLAYMEPAPNGCGCSWPLPLSWS